ncbi:hypothetical protein HN446_04935 [bacterium]|jgi:hypothetical protein|nr:hypothetical protein [bacterium]
MKRTYLVLLTAILATSMCLDAKKVSKRRGKTTHSTRQAPKRKVIHPCIWLSKNTPSALAQLYAIRCAEATENLKGHGLKLQTLKNDIEKEIETLKYTIACANRLGLKDNKEVKKLIKETISALEKASDQTEKSSKKLVDLGQKAHDDGAKNSEKMVIVA